MTVGRRNPPSSTKRTMQRGAGRALRPAGASSVFILALATVFAGCGGAGTARSSDREASARAPASTGAAPVVTASAPVAQRTSSTGTTATTTTTVKPGDSPKRATTPVAKPRRRSAPSAFECFRSHAGAAGCARPGAATMPKSTPTTAPSGPGCFAGTPNAKQCHRPTGKRSHSPRGAFDCFLSKAELARCRAARRGKN